MRYRPKGKRNITRRSRPNQAAQLAAERGLPYRTITDPSGAQRGEVNVGSEWVGAWGWFRGVAPTPQYRPKGKRNIIRGRLGGYGSLSPQSRENLQARGIIGANYSHWIRTGEIIPVKTRKIHPLRIYKREWTMDRSQPQQARMQIRKDKPIPKKIGKPTGSKIIPSGDSKYKVKKIPRRTGKVGGPGRFIKH